MKIHLYDFFRLEKSGTLYDVIILIKSVIIKTKITINIIYS